MTCSGSQVFSCIFRTNTASQLQSARISRQRFHGLLSGGLIIFRICMIQQNHMATESHGRPGYRSFGRTGHKMPRPAPTQNFPPPDLPDPAGFLPQSVLPFHYVYQYRDETPSSPYDLLYLSIMYINTGTKLHPILLAKTGARLHSPHPCF